MYEALLARASALLVALLAAGCATVPVVTTPLAATPLLGPYPSRDGACRALVTSAAREGWRSTTCAATPLAEVPGSPLGAAVLMVRDAAAADPRLVGTGSFFLGISASSAWFLTEKAIDQVNGAAGHSYLPVVTAESAVVVARHGGDARVLYQLRDATDSVCNVCEGAERDKRTPVAPRSVWMVCGRVGSSKPECTPPLFLSAGAQVALEDDTLTVTEPGKPRVVYAISF